MPKLVFLVTSHIDKGLAVAEAWEAAGAPGVTLIESFGLHHLRRKSLELPLFVSMAQVMREIEQTNQTLFTIVDEDLVDKLADAACTALSVKSLDEPDAGIMFVLDVERTFGMKTRRDGPLWQTSSR
jgi:nitrogen regulatory protein PII